MANSRPVRGAKRTSTKTTTSTAPSGPKANAGPPSQTRTFLQTPDKDWDSLDVELKDIATNPYNKRKMRKLEELAASIEKDGLAQPIAVMDADEWLLRYPHTAEQIGDKRKVIAFGERRFRATVLTGATTIMATQRNDVIPKILDLLYLENGQREDLTAVEEANLLQDMLDEAVAAGKPMNQRALAERVSRSLSHVSRRLGLLKLHPDLQEAVEDGKLPVDHARIIREAFADDHDQQLATWGLMRDHQYGPEDAVTLVLAGQEAIDRALGLGEEVEEDDGPETEDSPAESMVDTDTVGTPSMFEPDGQDEDADSRPDPAKPIVPAGRTPESNVKPAAKAPAAAAVPSGAAQAPKPATRNAKAVERSRASDERVQAGTHRDEVCKTLIAGEIPDELFIGVVGRALLTREALTSPRQQDAVHIRAHAWLRAADMHGIDVSQAAGYFEAVRSSSDNDLQRRCSFAVALAALEIRAADGRRQWDSSDIAHVTALIDHAAYEPKTPWEQEAVGYVPAGNSPAV
ncbi:ParB/RepB/Spo0J family partition protein [Kitasatospora sp. NPDC088548]|uniref:ParB/RepB/Spo0J family partition protein n=1 Tax=Kitasatospora sp. NPDC088548 TaxID=3364075 RepID=UPI0038228784